VLPGLPSNEKNSSDHHCSYNEGPYLVFFSFTESPSNSLSTIKFSKNSNGQNWLLRTLGANTLIAFFVWHIPCLVYLRLEST
jgi:hypothetical protein